MNKLINSLNNFYRYSKDKPLIHFKSVADKIPTHEFTSLISMDKKKVSDLSYYSLYACDYYNYSISLIKWKQNSIGPLKKYSNGSSLVKPIIGDLELLFYDNQKIHTKTLKLNKDFNFINSSNGYHQIVNPNNISCYSIHIHSPTFIDENNLFKVIMG